jgi:Tfp pilus assembly protein PilN
MINLLPPKTKQDIIYARRNTRLRQWGIALCIGIVSIVAITLAGHFYLQQSISSLSAQAEQGKANFKNQNLEETQTKVQQLTDSLKLVTQVLQREILFSKLLSQTGAALPNGSVLTDLSINKLQGGLDLRVSATDYQTATQVQLNLQDPNNKIFEKADIVNIQCVTPKPGNNALQNQYPCNVQLRTLFAKNNSFSFISPKAGSSP